jgi:hypothetical protein
MLCARNLERSAHVQSLLTMRAVQASIAVVVITLVLFFASGMYEEKIRYAHRCVRCSHSVGRTRSTQRAISR